MQPQKVWRRHHGAAAIESAGGQSFRSGAVLDFSLRSRRPEFRGLDTVALRLEVQANEVFRPGPHEKNGEAQRPMPAIFVRSSETPPPSADGSPARPTAPGTLIDANGQEYVG